MFVSPLGWNDVSYYGNKASRFFKSFFSIEVVAFCILIGICVYVYFEWSKTDKPNEQRQLLRQMLYENSDDESYPKSRGRKKPVFKMQERCRDIFQEIFQKPFPTCKPEFLRNPVTGKRLELDGYNEEMRLAFEYDGIQHSQYDRYFHGKDPKAFMYQVAKDDYKTKKCRLENVTLIRIPHFIHVDGLKDYILRKLREQKIKMRE